jgi:hypothetical protein
MSKAGLDRSLPKLTIHDATKQHRTEDLLRKAIDTMERPRLRLILQGLCKKTPEPKNVTASLLVITRGKYKKEVAESSKGNTQDADSEGGEDNYDADFESNGEEKDDFEREIDAEDCECERMITSQAKWYTISL